jgi:hypothetical protein
MLENETYRKLRERNWLEIVRKESNPSQFWHRIRDNVRKTIDQLALLATKLPDDKQEEIFNYGDIKKLITSIFTKNNSSSPIDELSDARRTHLAALLVEEGMKVCIKKYELLLNDTPALTEPTIRELNRAKDICKEIAYKVDLNQRKLAIQKEEEKSAYLFSWNRIPGTDNGKLAEFIRDEFGEFNFKWIKSITKKNRGETIFFSYRDDPKPPRVFYIRLNADRKSAIAYNYDPEDKEDTINNKHQTNLVVKAQYDNLYIYQKET